MRTIIVCFAVVLLVIGAVGFLAAGMQHWTALIPAIFGALLLAIAQVPALAGREAVLGGAGVAAAALLLFGSAGALGDVPAAVSGAADVNAPAVLARAVTAVVAIVAVLAIAARWLRQPRRAGAAR